MADNLLAHELAQHAAALRTMARALVGSSDADDLVQETALRALRTPPSQAAGLGGFLVTILRRLAITRHRGDAHRQQRERSAARPEAVAGPEHELARHEIVARLTQALLSLPEPYRDTLLRRFFEDCLPATIAERTGVPVETVKTRLKRGLAMLRERLDAEGSRDEWCAELAVVFGLEPAGIGIAAAVATGAILMGTGTKLVMAGIAAIVAVGALFFFTNAAPAALRVQQSSQTDAMSPVVGDMAANATQATGASAERSDVTSQAPSTTPLANIHGRCVAAETGAPLAGCRVEMNGRLRDGALPTGWTDPPRLNTSVNGTFELAVPARDDTELVTYWRADDRLYRMAILRATTPGMDLDLGDVSLSRGAKVHGRVVDEAGKPIVDAPLSVRELPIGLSTPFSNGAQDSIYIKTSADGTFAFAEPVPPGNWRFEARLPAMTLMAPHIITVPTNAADFPMQVVMAKSPSIAGVVVDPAGNPIAGAELVLNIPHENELPGATTRADGTFELFARSIDPPAGRLLVSKADGFDPPSPIDPVSWGTRDLRLVLPRALQVTVHVIERASRAPVERFAVLAVPVGAWGTNDELDYPPAPTPEGRRALDNFRRGPHRIAAFPTDPSLQPSLWCDIDVEQAQDAIELFVDRLEPLQVQVHDGAGTPRAGVSVEVIQLGDFLFNVEGLTVDPTSSRENYIERWPRGAAQAQTLSKATTDTDGNAAMFTRYDGTPFGLAIRVTGPRLDPLLLRNPPLVRNQPFDIVVHSGIPLAGHVQVKGYAPGTAHIVAEHVVQPSFIGGGEATAINPDGTFAFDSLRSGEFRIWFAIAPNYRSPASSSHSEAMKLEPPLAQLSLREGQQKLELDASRFAAARVRGRILVDGVPMLTPRVIACLHGWVTFGQFQGGPDGSFAAENLPPGPYQIGFAIDENRETPVMWHEDAIELSPGAELARDFHFTRRTLRVHVLDKAGDPIAGATVKLATPYTSTCRSDASGTAVFHWVHSGKMTVSLPDPTAPEIAQEFEFDAAQTERVIELRKK